MGPHGRARPTGRLRSWTGMGQLGHGAALRPRVVAQEQKSHPWRFGASRGSDGEASRAPGRGDEVARPVGHLGQCTINTWLCLKALVLQYAYFPFYHKNTKKTCKG